MKVVIVGAGVAGLSIGWRLLQAGAEVVLLERAQPATGATWAAAGMLSALGEGNEPNHALSVLSRYAADRWPDFAREIEQVSGRALRYRRDGKLVVARSPAELEHLAAYAARGPDLSVISASAARVMEPMLAGEIVGALWDPGEAQVDNRALGTALLDVYLCSGGELRANETVVRIETDGAHVLGARTPFGLVEGDAYILASGAWTSRIDGLSSEALPPVVPVKGEMIALAGGEPPTRIIWGEGVYLVPRDGRLLVGATSSLDGFDTSLTEGARSWLLAQATMLMPPLTAWDVVEHWAGLRPGSPDDLPILGHSVLDSLWVATGQFRNGILFAPAVAELIAALVLGRQAPIDISGFDPRRFSVASLAKPKTVG